MRLATLLGLVAACSVPEPGRSTPVSWVAETGGGAATLGAASIADRYREPAAKIIATASADRGAYVKLAQLTDRIGHRLSGSAQLDQAIAWAVQAMKDDGHTTRTEPVLVPRWVRGGEAAELVTPIARPLRVLGLGGSVPTPRSGITAPIVVVHDWAELEAKRGAVKGAIVLYDVAMPAWSEATGSGYGAVVEYRTHGASRAAKHGAVGTLMRSVTAHSLQTPHTGAMRYEEGVAKIPSAAITVEDGALIARLASNGPVTVHLALESQNLAEVPSANVIGELRGRDRPDEIVVLGAHLDSWDVGQGAHDDGAGCVMMMQALTVLKRLGLTPRRTIRVVLFTNEENGLRGGKQYAKDHAGELANTVFALESDSGGFAPRGFSVGKLEGPHAANGRLVMSRITDIASLLKPINATRVVPGHGGADIGPMGPAGVPLVGLDTHGDTYFDIHHTAADTLDKVDPVALAANVAAVAVLAYVIADLPTRVDAPESSGQ